MLNKKIMVLALILVSLLTISCVSAAEDGNDALNTISVNGIDDEQVVEASVDDAEVGMAEENNNLQLAPEDFNVTFYGDTFETESTAKLLRFYWPDEVDSVHIIVSGAGIWDGDWNRFKHDGETFQDVPFNEIYIFDPCTCDVTVCYGDMEIAGTTLTVIKELKPNNFIELYSKDITNSSDYITNVYDSYNGGKGLEGNVTVTADGVLVYSEVFTGTGVISKKITSADLTTSLSGNKYVVVTYQRDVTGKSYDRTATINFISGEPTGSANTTLYLFYDAKKFTLEAYLIDDDQGKVIGGAPVVINLSGASYNLVTDSYGWAKLSTTFLEPGSYTAYASYAGSDTYKPSSAMTSFVFARTDTSIVFDYYEYSNTLYITLVDNTNWPVKYADLVINFNGNTYNRKADEYGCVEFYVGDLASGIYTVNVSYAGNATFNPTSASYDIIVGSGDSILYCDYYADTRQLAITLTDPYALPIGYADVTVALGGSIYNLVTDSNGQATIDIPNLAPGVYTADVSYEGDASFGPAFVSYDFVVEKFDTSISAVYSNGEIIATLTNDVTGQPIKGFTLKINLDGVTYKLGTDAKGQVKLSTAGLAPGTYTATVTFNGGTKYNPAQTTVTFIAKADTVVSLNYDDNAKLLVATLTNDATGQPIKGFTLRINLDGVTYRLGTDANGQVSVSTADLAPGTYDIEVTFNGGSKYYPSAAAETIIVKDKSKADTIVLVDYDDNSKLLVATLINDDTGKPIKGFTLRVYLNGVTYKLGTDANGQVKLSTADLAPGTYDVAVIFNGGTKYYPSSANETISVKLNTTVSLSYDDNAKLLVATLTNDATGQPIKGFTLRVSLDGVTYRLGTDANGQVKLSTADLSPGTYTATVTFLGGSKYHPSNATVSFVKT